MISGHTPVLLQEVLQLFVPRAGCHYLDATFGGGGHSAALLEAAPNVLVTAIDCDPQAAERATFFKNSYGDRFIFHEYDFIGLKYLNFTSLDGVLFDLGLSSFHIDQDDRGFSFRSKGIADMRFNTRKRKTAANFLQTASKYELIRSVRDYGEDPCWRKKVADILAARTQINANGIPLLSTTEGITRVIGMRQATRIFQGIRMVVNEELVALIRALPAAFGYLDIGGTLIVISFHSIEDRIVKRYFNSLSIQLAELLTTQTIMPSKYEIFRNPRSRSARLRAVRKLRNIQ